MLASEYLKPLPDDIERLEEFINFMREDLESQISDPTKAFNLVQIQDLDLPKDLGDQLKASVERQRLDTIVTTTKMILLKIGSILIAQHTAQTKELKAQGIKLVAETVELGDLWMKVITSQRDKFIETFHQGLVEENHGCDPKFSFIFQISILGIATLKMHHLLKGQENENPNFSLSRGG